MTPISADPTVGTYCTVLLRRCKYSVIAPKLQALDDKMWTPVCKTGPNAALRSQDYWRYAIALYEAIQGMGIIGHPLPSPQSVIA